MKEHDDNTEWVRDNDNKNLWHSTIYFDDTKERVRLRYYKGIQAELVYSLKGENKRHGLKVNDKILADFWRVKMLAGETCERLAELGVFKFY